MPIVQKIHGHLEKYGDSTPQDQDEIMETDQVETLDEDIGENHEIFGAKRIKEGPLGLVLCPTRELAVQVHDQIKLLSTHTKVKTAVIIGGMSDDKQGKVLG